MKALKLPRKEKKRRKKEIQKYLRNVLKVEANTKNIRLSEIGYRLVK